MKYLIHLIIILFYYNFTFAGSLKIIGSSTLYPMLKEMSANFMLEKNIQVFLSSGGSAKGVECVLSGACDIGASTKPPAENKIKEYNILKIGIDGIAIVVHTGVTIKNITTKQLIDIYSGKTKNWQMLGGPNIPIVAYQRDPNHGSVELMKHLLGLNTLIGIPIGAQTQVVLSVGESPGAIGFMSLGNAIKLGAGKISILNVNGVNPSDENIKSGKYQFIRPLLLLTKVNNLKPEVSAFYDFIDKNVVKYIDKYEFNLK